MTVLVEGQKSFFIGSQAHLVTTDRELAWAERTVRHNPAYKWVLGRFVEADKANKNRQYWALDQLRMAQPSIQYAPMNMLHRPHQIVGAFVDTEMIYPTDEQAAESHPYIDALGVFYSYYFPEALHLIEHAHATGSLYFSMECVAKDIVCAGDTGCGKSFAYEGPKHPSYCEHLNDGLSIKQLEEPHFLAGALIVPPEKPGWPGAEVNELSSLVETHSREMEMAYEQISEDMDHLSPTQWEFIMGKIVSLAAGRQSE